MDLRDCRDALHDAQMEIMRKGSVSQSTAETLVEAVEFLLEVVEYQQEGNQ